MRSETRLNSNSICFDTLPEFPAALDSRVRILRFNAVSTSEPMHAERCHPQDGRKGNRHLPSIRTLWTLRSGTHRPHRSHWHLSAIRELSFSEDGRRRDKSMRSWMNRSKNQVMFRAVHNDAVERSVVRMTFDMMSNELENALANAHNNWPLSIPKIP